jgi:hypothetical protein
MSMRSTLVLVTVVAASALVAAGCGGSSRNKAYSGSKAAYAGAMNSVCRTVNARRATLGRPTSTSDFVEKESLLLETTKAAEKKLKSLVPPDEIKSNAEHFISVVHQLNGKVGNAIDAAEVNDQAKLKELIGEITALSKTGDVDARAIGAPACLSTASA